MEDLEFETITSKKKSDDAVDVDVTLRFHSMKQMLKRMKGSFKNKAASLPDHASSWLSEIRILKKAEKLVIRFPPSPMT